MFDGNYPTSYYLWLSPTLPASLASAFASVEKVRSATSTCSGEILRRKQLYLGDQLGWKEWL